MEKDSNIFFLTGDLGFGLADSIMKDFPDRAINCGASEQCMLDMACGLALEGKIPFVYTITPFLIYRGFETLRTYVNHEVINIKLIGSGRDADYAHDGWSHDASDIYHFLEGFNAIGKFYPGESIELELYFEEMLVSKNPSCMLLYR